MFTPRRDHLMVCILYKAVSRAYDIFRVYEGMEGRKIKIKMKKN
jgi:hypothetical protein